LEAGLRGLCKNYWFGGTGLTYKLRDAAVGIPSTQQARERRRAEYEAAADVAWEELLDPA